jgi:HisJ family histidinol phosphate phosphatase
MSSLSVFGKCAAQYICFLIGSVHMAARRHGAFDLYFIEKNTEAFYHDVIDGYMEEMEKLVQWGKFDVIGHMTLPLRYINEHHGLSMTFSQHMHQAEEIFRLIIPKGIGIECNVNRGKGCLPEAEVLKLYRSMGGEIITIGSDAHIPEHTVATAQMHSGDFQFFGIKCRILCHSVFSPLSVDLHYHYILFNIMW